MTIKQPGWEGRLIEYLQSVAGAPFRPGTIDCGLFFGGAVKAMSGQDIDKPFRGKYRTIEGAMKIAAKLGFKDHAEYAASLFEELPSPLHAQRGDLAVVDDMNGFPALGVVQGENIYCMSLTGLTIAKLTAAKKAYRV